MRLKSKQLISPLAVAALLLAAPAISARAATTVLSQLTGFDQMVVDDSAGHVFLSEGAGGQGIVVTDLSGTYQTTLDAGDNVDGLALSSDGSTLYAAVAGGTDVGKVAQITVSSVGSTLIQTFDSLGSASNVPYRLALQSGQLWVSYNNGGIVPTGAIGAIDPATGTFTANAAGGSWYSAPIIAADPQDSGILVAATPGLSPAPVTSFKVASTPATMLAQTNMLSGSSGGGDNCDNLRDIAVVPGGAQFIPACGAPYAHNVYSTADLSLQSTYTTIYYPNAVAIAPDGTVAAGVFNWYNPSIYLFSQGGSSPLNTIQFTSPDTLANGGLAWSADGSTLYAVEAIGSSYSLNVYTDPRMTQSTLALTGPSSAYVGQSLTLTGSLSLASGVAPGAVGITVKRTDSSGTVTTLPAVTTSSDGGFTVTDIPPAKGTYTYTASYAGTSTTAPATASDTVAVSLVPSAIALTAPASARIGTSYTINGKLNLGAGTVPAGRQIQITRTKPNSTTLRWTRQTDSSGAFSLTDKPPVAGTYTYTFAYAGTSTIQPATSTRQVEVTKIPTALKITTSASTLRYDGTVKVTAHLGTTYKNRTVAIYARTVGSSTNVLLKKGTVNSYGNLKVSYTATRSKVFTAVFTGDAHYQAKKVTRTVGVHVKITAKATGYYATATYSGTTFHIYHHTAKLWEVVTVTPNKHGQCVILQAQEYYYGSWHANTTTGCGYLNSYSKVGGYLTLGQADLGYHYRIRADYLRSTADHTNLNSDSGWFYFIVRN